TFFLLAIAIMTVNEYDFFKFLTTSIVTVLFIVLMALVVILVVTLSQQIIKFFTTIYTEMFYR
ncbi:MAG: YIP1 family protein, partial [Clostridia bacterium]|nr:YIP1 family protein [Clostridia bacterium]